MNDRVAPSMSGPDGGMADGAARDRAGALGSGKAPAALRTIGEVAEALGIRQHVLRYWEEQFPMLRPLKRSGGRRYYRPEDVALIQRIDHLVHAEGYTLRGARVLLEDKGKVNRAADKSARLPEAASPAEGVKADEGPVGAARMQQPDMRPRLQALRDRLAAALAD